MVAGSARLGPLSDYTANCRPVLSSERAPYMKKQVSRTVKHVHGHLRGARHQDELAD
jgi:hypothetical protein